MLPHFLFSFERSIDELCHGDRSASERTGEAASRRKDACYGGMRTLMCTLNSNRSSFETETRKPLQETPERHFHFSCDEKQNKTWSLEPQRGSLFTNGEGPRRSQVSTIPLTFNLKSLKVFSLHWGTCGLCLSAVLKVVQAQQHQTHSWCVWQCLSSRGNISTFQPRLSVTIVTDLANTQPWAAEVRLCLGEPSILLGAPKKSWHSLMHNTEMKSLCTLKHKHSTVSTGTDRSMLGLMRRDKVQRQATDARHVNSPERWQTSVTPRTPTREDRVATRLRDASGDPHQEPSCSHKSHAFQRAHLRVWWKTDALFGKVFTSEHFEKHLLVFSWCHQLYYLKYQRESLQKAACFHSEIF